MSLAAPSREASGRGRRLVPPLVTAAAFGAATAAVALRDPHVPGSWGVCPWLLLTGTYCPGCGGLRAVYDLVHLRFVDALSSNAVVVVGAVAACLVWVVWMSAVARGRAVDWRRWATPSLGYAVLGVLAVFSVLRNLPVGAWLAP